jgi:cytochrome c biogenesis factor
LLVAEDKPFISFVWAGVFLLMAGFSVSIVRHRGRLANHSKPADSPEDSPAS